MIVLGIDPGPLTCGSALYDTTAKRVLESRKGNDVAELLAFLRDGRVPFLLHLVAIERVQSYGIAGASLLETAEVCGRLHQRALDSGLQVQLLYRRQVLKVLDVTGKGSRDAMVRQRLIEMHGGSREAAVGRKATQGPLYGLAGHGWQALAVAVAVAATIEAEALVCALEAAP